ncbi:MAG: hypothetical protein P8R54_08970, partial [Myxococcota bacterium]|nr:hypothetical protein [Myxococcota bacterium]
MRPASLIVPDGVRRKKKAKARKQSGKLPGFDERWVPWEELLQRVFGRDVLLHNGCLPRLRESDLAGRSLLHNGMSIPSARDLSWRCWDCPSSSFPFAPPEVRRRTGCPEHLGT